MLWLGAGSAVAGVLLLRYGWELPRRHVPLLSGAWGLVVLGLIGGAVGEGAWGVAVVSLALMLCAFLCLAVAGWTAPPDKARPSERRAHILPDKGKPMHLWRRVLTFLMTVPLALIASLALAMAIRLLIAGSGGGEANANVATLFLMPVFWSILAVLLLITARRRSQWLMLAAPVLVGGLCIIIGTRP